MRILYIDRDYGEKGFKWNLKRKWGVNRFREGFLFDGQSGFFQASLHYKCKVDIKDRDFLTKKIMKIHNEYDAVIIDYKFSHKKNRSYKDFEFIKKNKNICKVLLVATAEAGNIPGDDILDLFDIVYKREHYIDLDKYNINSDNKNKLKLTILSCPVIKLSKDFFGNVCVHEPFKSVERKNFSHDIFFAGSATNRHRSKVYDKINDFDFNVVGGIQPRNTSLEWQKNFRTPRYSRKKYVDLILKSKINLALEGYGEFTYRHLELWYLKTFMISSPSIRNVELFEKPKEGVHYVVYDDLDDMIDKIKYYLDHEDQRSMIAQEGRYFFDRIYDYKIHGEHIFREIRALA